MFRAVLEATCFQVHDIFEVRKDINTKFIKRPPRQQDFYLSEINIYIYICINIKIIIMLFCAKMNKRMVPNILYVYREKMLLTWHY